MRRKIPSIDALIAFEAAARHLSFTRTAEELSLTQSAVGRQVASLEEYLGTPLFNRFKRRISLTEAGEIYAKRVRENLERLERDTLAAMAHRNAGGILELAVIPTFATRWLIPRLPEFYAAHEDIVVNLTTRTAPFLFKDTPFDAAMHFGDPVWPGSVAKYLFGCSARRSPPYAARVCLRAKRNSLRGMSRASRCSTSRRVRTHGDSGWLRQPC